MGCSSHTRTTPELFQQGTPVRLPGEGSPTVTARADAYTREFIACQVNLSHVFKNKQNSSHGM